MTMNELAHEIATEQCISTIEYYGITVRSANGVLLWYEVDPEDKFGGWEIKRALRYLDARKLLRRHKVKKNWVKPR